MAKKALKTYRDGKTPNKAMTRVYFDDEWDEYTVALFVDGKKQQNATYHTADEADAYSTARVMLTAAGEQTQQTEA